MVFILFVVGFILLVKGADWLVDAASNIALRFGLSDLLIGLTIISLGTSLPELLVSLLASISGSSGLAVGNILGSNIANILLVLGITALVKDLPIHRNTLLSEVPFSIAAAFIIGFLANTAFWYEAADGLLLSQGDGIIIIFFFLLFMAYLVLQAKENRMDFSSDLPSLKENTPTWKNSLYILIGIIALTLGGNWVVDGAIEIATLFGFSESFIGLTIVAIGTSLPELVTSLRAAMKNNTDIAIGNAVGSNLFNLLWVLGLSATIQPLPFDATANTDLLMVIASSCLLILALIVGRRMTIKKYEGIIFLVIYVLYLYYLIQRG